MRFRIASLAAFLFLSPAGVVHAEDPVADARAVISAQISALMNDDADKAYSLASPGIRSLYPDKKVFFAMVRDNYEAVYQAGTYAFGRSKLVGGGEVVLQEVMISAKQGKDWTAIYDMRLMDDGSYKVNGVRGSISPLAHSAWVSAQKSSKRPFAIASRIPFIRS
ncbi:MAG: DUF4864 domain-containing protein [Rhizobiaceae bacterium]|nr:MAG: DUF4864 domain-containing protein [Rhizobiaceae bacterium]